MAAFNCPPEIFFQDSQIIEIKMSAERVGRLCRFVHHDLARDDAGGLRRLGPAIYGRGGIYQSKGYYFLPNTCNVWTREDWPQPIAPSPCHFAPSRRRLSFSRKGLAAKSTMGWENCP